MIKIAVQFNYIAKKGWRPKNTDNYVITLLKIEISASAITEAKKSGKSQKELFEEAAATVAAESSTGTWTKVYDGKNSGIPLALEKRALAYDLDYKRQIFKIAYPIELFELDNISGLLAGITGNIAGMKMHSGLRVYDVLLPKKMIEKFPGPAFGIDGVRKMLNHPKGPLTVTVPKPKIGRSDTEQAILAYQLATSGNGTYGGIKDDENLTSLDFNNIEKRINLVLNQLNKAEKETGRKKFYLCNITHSNIEKMEKHAKMIKSKGGRYMMIDVVTTGFTALDSMRRKNTGLAIHAHRAMHGFITRDNSPGVHGDGKLFSFSVSMIFLAKMFRLMGVDNLHGGSPLAKMEDYGEAIYIKDVLQNKITKPHSKIPSLGQNWHHIKPVWMVASGGLHPGDIETVLDSLGDDIVMQFGGGLLGHPDGVEAGVIAVEQAIDAYYRKIPLRKFVKSNPNSALARAVELWGYGPRIVY